MNKLFPIFVKAEKLKLLVVGGGNVGLEKLTALLANSPAAQIDLVAPLIKEEIEHLAAEHEHLTLHFRPFQLDDLQQKDLVFCATDNKDLHHEIRSHCRETNILVNVADTPDLCDFYLGSIVQKGDLKIGISTNGKSPTVAKRIKEFLYQIIPDDFQSILNQMKNVRDQIKGDFEKKVEVLNNITANWLTDQKNR